MGHPAAPPGGVSRMRGVAAFAACLLLVLAGAAAPAQAGAAAPCSGTGSGVTVVVDLSAFGGGVEVTCVSGDPASGLAALRAAGYSTQGTQRDGPGFVCRIDGLPGDDPCVNTPPTTAYWAYWYAERGGSWTYSSSGAANRDPEPGDVDGWAFGAGVQPGIAPPAAPAPPRPPREDPPDDPPDREDQAEPDPPADQGEPDQPTRPDAEPDAEASESPEPRSPAPVTDPATSAPSSPETGGPDAPRADPVARTSSGSPLGVVIGLGLVAALGAAAWLVNRRRLRT